MPNSKTEQLGPRVTIPVKSADRTIDTLELLSQSPQPLTLTEIQRALGAPKSSMHGLLRTLVARGWIETDQWGTRYGIGLRALRVGTAYLDRDPVVQVVTPILSALRRDLDETVHLARLDGSSVLYLASRESRHHLRASSRIGRRLPAHATALGKAILASRTWPEVLKIVSFPLEQLTPHTVSSRADLRQELETTAERGWAAEREQGTPGLGCFSVALAEAGRPATDALSCSVPLARITDEHAAQIVGALIQVRHDILTPLGPQS